MRALCAVRRLVLIFPVPLARAAHRCHATVSPLIPPCHDTLHRRTAQHDRAALVARPIAPSAVHVPPRPRPPRLAASRLVVRPSRLPLAPAADGAPAAPRRASCCLPPSLRARGRHALRDVDWCIIRECPQVRGPRPSLRLRRHLYRSQLRLFCRRQAVQPRESLSSSQSTWSRATTVWTSGRAPPSIYYAELKPIISPSDYMCSFIFMLTLFY